MPDELKTAVLSGSSRGIGRATALALSAAGFRLALLGRDSAAQRETLDLLDAQKSSHRLFECDLREAQGVQRASEAALLAFGAPHVIVHCAGVVLRAPADKLLLSAWDEQFAVNVRAAFIMVQSFLGGMLERGSGRILLVGSISSTLGTVHQTAYNASKWAVVGFMKSLAEELKDTGLMTLAVLPGSVETRMLEDTGFAPRMGPEAVANTLKYCATEASLAHNGGVIELFGV